MLAREQCIGENKVWGAFESTIRGKYEELVQKAEEQKKETTTQEPTQNVNEN